MMKKAIALITAVMLWLTFTACGKQPKTHDNSEFSDLTTGKTADVTSGEINDESDDNSTVHSQKPTDNSISSASAPEESITAEKEEAETNPPETTGANGKTEASTPPEKIDSTESVEDNQEEPVSPSESVTETPPTESKPPVTENKPQEYTQKDHDRIIAEVRAYAESYSAKGYDFIWLDTMEFGWDVGYMGTPRIKRDGVDGVIRILKNHIDLIVQTTTDPSNGITCSKMTYKVMQIDLDGEIAFVVVYGG